ncbi:hypothetical protein NHJ6243_009659, partial [Beauveria neobassiana]
MLRSWIKKVAEDAAVRLQPLVSEDRKAPKKDKTWS